MTELRFTLLTDGPSDASLISPLTWLLQTNGVRHALNPQWADLSHLPQRPRGLRERIKTALSYYPCELLFVHRDAERERRETRVAEILGAIKDLAVPPLICVVPVRMTEAWFLFDEAAIRRAAGNPNGKEALGLPNLSRHEDEPDPKQVLRFALLAATGMSLRRQRGFPVTERVRRLAELIDDFSSLRSLAAFCQLEKDLKAIIRVQNWRS